MRVGGKRLESSLLDDNDPLQGEKGGSSNTSTMRTPGTAAVPQQDGRQRSDRERMKGGGNVSWAVSEQVAFNLRKVAKETVSIGANTDSDLHKGPLWCSSSFSCKDRSWIFLSFHFFLRRNNKNLKCTLLFIQVGKFSPALNPSLVIKEQWGCSEVSRGSSWGFSVLLKDTLTFNEWAERGSDRILWLRGDRSPENRCVVTVPSGFTSHRYTVLSDSGREKKCVANVLLLDVV